MTSAPSELICHGAAERLFDASSVTAEVQRGVDVQTAVDVMSLEERMLSVKLWLTFLGIKNTPIDKVLSDHLPCFQMMVQSTPHQRAEGGAVLAASLVPAFSPLLWARASLHAREETHAAARWLTLSLPAARLTCAS